MLLAKMERAKGGMRLVRRERAERGVKVCARSVGLRGEEWAEEARPAGESPAANGASSTRGRRGVGSIHWGGDSRGVIARGAAKRRQRRLGEEDPARIERAREGFQIGAGARPIRQWTGAVKIGKFQTRCSPDF